jgi:4-hydroxy-tetrahydrodipicolinate synthase
MEALEGVYVAVVTPIDGTQRIDTAGLGKNVRWLASQGVDGVVALGSTGEFASLNDSERADVIEAVVGASDGQVPVLVGVGAETTERTIQNLRDAERRGASGTLVLPPWYYTPSEKELVRHFRAIGEAASTPLMIYNNPFTSKVDVTPDVLCSVADLETIVAVKESSGNIRRIAEIRMRTEDRLTVFCGWEDMAYESFVLGARGWICVAGNVVPGACVDLYRETRDLEKLDDAWGLYRKLLPFLRYLEYKNKTAPTIKFLLDRMGLAGGQATSPKAPLSEREEEELLAIAKELDLRDSEGARLG